MKENREQRKEQKKLGMKNEGKVSEKRSYQDSLFLLPNSYFLIFNALRGFAPLREDKKEYTA
jgi:hypothetical protein